MAENNNSKASGIIGTIVFHTLVFLLFAFIIFKTPIPPFPEEGGSGYEVNFGTDETGSGAEQPISTSGNNDVVDETNIMSQPSETNTSSSQAENILTNDIQTESTAEIVKGNSETRVEKDIPKVEEKPKEEIRKANVAALYKGRKKGTAAESNEGETGGKGDQGSLDGSTTSRYRGNGGNGGSGDGEGKGNGLGQGNKNGAGISFSLEGRKSSSLPIPKASFTEEGRVVVEIKVDQNGVVVFAKPGVKGSTTTNPQLMEIARKAALSASFDTNHDAPDVQRGTIIYNFFLK